MWRFQDFVIGKISNFNCWQNLKLWTYEQYVTALPNNFFFDWSAVILYLALEILDHKDFFYPYVSLQWTFVNKIQCPTRIDWSLTLHFSSKIEQSEVSVCCRFSVQHGLSWAFNGKRIIGIVAHITVNTVRNCMSNSNYSCITFNFTVGWSIWNLYYCG